MPQRGCVMEGKQMRTDQNATMGEVFHATIPDDIIGQPYKRDMYKLMAVQPIRVSAPPWLKHR